METIAPHSRMRRRSQTEALDHAGNRLRPIPSHNSNPSSLTVQGSSSHLPADVAQQHGIGAIHGVHEGTPSDQFRDSFDDANREYFEARKSTYDDRDTIVERHLGATDVLALVFNKMVGSGIFIAPAQTLALTRSPTVSIIMWVLGGLYTALGLLLYLEYGTQFPYNGGELIYLDRIFKPGFLFTIFFAAFNLCLGNTTGNAIQFGTQVVDSGLNGALFMSEDEPSAIDDRIVKLVAWVALTLACGVLYHLPRLGMFINKILALFKVILLIIIFAKGFQHSQDRMGPHPAADSSFIDNMSAMVYVIYSYTGWENGNYVAGEIRDLSEKKAISRLLKGSMGAVLLTTILYVLVVVAYYLATPYDAVVRGSRLLGMGEYFAPKVFGNNGKSYNIMVAISAFGNLIAVVYTSAKIKQAIARQRFIPLWQYIELDRNSTSSVPKGGLVLHWITTTIWIIALPLHKDGYAFIIGLSTYGRILIETAVFGGIIFFFWRKSKRSEYSFILLRNPWSQLGLPIVLIGFNGLLLVVAAMRVKDVAIPRYWFSAAMGMLFVGSLMYWSGIKLLLRPISRPARDNAVEMRNQDGSQIALNNVPAKRDRFANLVGFKTFELYQWNRMKDQRDWPERMEPAMEESQADGTERRLDSQASLPSFNCASYSARY